MNQPRVGCSGEGGLAHGNAFRGTSCPNKIPVGQIVATPGTRPGSLVETGIDTFNYVPYAAKVTWYRGLLR